MINLFRRLLFLDYKIIVLKNLHLSNCPKCGSLATLKRLNHEHRIENFWRELGIKKYYCGACKWSGYLFIKRFTDNPKRILKNYIITAIIIIALTIIGTIILHWYYQFLG